MTTPPPAPAPELDFSFLSAGLGIVGTSPAWPEVEAALGRLEAGTGASDADRKADIALVQEYARKLSREANTLGRALVAAAAIGALASGDRRARVRRGLEVLSAGHDLRHLRPAEVTEVLKRLMREIVERYRPPRFRGAYSLRRPRTPEQWGALVGEDCGAVEINVRVKGVDPDETWMFWLGYLSAVLGTKEPSEPVLPMLICDAAGIGPGAWLRIAPRTMTLREWSRVVLGVVGAVPPATEAPPAWAGAAALWALGFPDVELPPVRRPAVKRAPKPAAVDGDRGLLRAALPPRAPRAAALVVAPPESDFVGAWLPAAPELAVLVLTPHELARLEDSAPGFVTQLAERVGTLYLVVEVGADGAEPPGLSHALRGVAGKLPRVDLYRALPTTTPLHHLVVAPADAAELLRGLLTQAQR